MCCEGPGKEAGGGIRGVGAGAPCGQEVIQQAYWQVPPGRGVWRRKLPLTRLNIHITCAISFYLDIIFRTC